MLVNYLIMVEAFVFIMFSMVFQYTFLNDHPLVLGGGLLGIMVFLGGVLCHFGPTFSFSIFMVVTGGVLVVFSFVIALIPFSSVKAEDRKMSSLGQGFNSVMMKWSFSKSSFALLVSGLGGLWVLLVSFFVMWKRGFGEEVNKNFLGFSDISYFSNDYSVGMVWLGVVLFLVMVFSVGVASRYEGALLI